MLTREAFVRGMRALQGRFPKHAHPDKEALEWYYKYLKNRLTDDQFMSACERAFAELDRFPKPSTLYELAPHHLGERHYAEHSADPYVPQVLRVAKGSRYYREIMEMLDRRREAGTVVPLETKDGYAVAQIEIVGGGE